MKEIRENCRSLVRIVVTYAAAAYVFGGSTILIIAFLTAPDLVPADSEAAKLVDAKLSAAKDIFIMVLPVATGIITYWFASRKPGELELKEPTQPPQ